MKEINKVKQGKKNREAGARFERKVRKDLELKGWIVDRWTNNVKDNKVIPAKSRFNMRTTGFPDFILFSPSNSVRPKIMGVECKSNGYLNKVEKEKCKWLLENNIFSKIIIASKDKSKINYVHYTNLSKKEVTN
ncbi:MAG: hypothetical protein ACTSUC_09690 [Promethearchaeota archaeon]